MPSVPVWPVALALVKRQEVSRREGKSQSLEHLGFSTCFCFHIPNVFYS